MDSAAFLIDAFDDRLGERAVVDLLGARWVAAGSHARPLVCWMKKQAEATLPCRVTGRVVEMQRLLELGPQVAVLPQPTW